MVDCVVKLDCSIAVLGKIHIFQTLGQCYIDEKCLAKLLSATLSNYANPSENHFRITVREDGEEILW